MLIMNTKQGHENDPLDQALRQWAVDTPLPPRFQERVWQRIERAETRNQPSILALLWRRIEELLPRPAVAIGYLSIILAIGIGAGSFVAQAKAGRMDSELSVRYLASVDPFQAAGSP